VVASPHSRCEIVIAAIALVVEVVVADLVAQVEADDAAEAEVVALAVAAGANDEEAGHEAVAANEIAVAALAPSLEIASLISIQTRGHQRTRAATATATPIPTQISSMMVTAANSNTSNKIEMDKMEEVVADPDHHLLPLASKNR